MAKDKKSRAGKMLGGDDGPKKKPGNDPGIIRKASTNEGDRNKEAGLTKEGRKKFTTMVKPELSNRLKTEAIQRGMSAADLLEQILSEYFPDA